MAIEKTKSEPKKFILKFDRKTNDLLQDGNWVASIPSKRDLNNFGGISMCPLEIKRPASLFLSCCYGKWIDMQGREIKDYLYFVPKSE